MIFESTTIQKFSVQDAPDWLQVGDHQAYVGYIADQRGLGLMARGRLR